MSRELRNSFIIRYALAFLFSSIAVSIAPVHYISSGQAKIVLTCLTVSLIAFAIVLMLDAHLREQHWKRGRTLLEKL
jgi:predicted neutral ceramidase superfamily lipid hydrolase